MSDWLIVHLAALQAGIMRTLAAELRAGGLGTSLLAFSLGAVHALTPGHGKTALAAYFLGTEAPLGRGLRVALAAALLHVFSGFALFLVLRLLIGQLSSPSLTGRPSPAFTAVGYGLIVLAGALMLIQSLRPHRAAGDGGHALTAGVGLLPCPLTITVLGFAWAQGTIAMLGLVLISLALGVATTIAAVAVLAIVARSAMGAALADRLPRLDRGARVLQAIAASAIIAIGLYTLWALRA
jgi:ABC-type nickel/cobalt efflux system permease component RcnA